MAVGAAAALWLALLVDRLWGEPPARLHPVVAMGGYLGWAGRRLPQAPRAAFAAPPDVLVLDDSEIAVRFLCRLLGDFGFRAHPVRDSAAAWPRTRSSCGCPRTCRWCMSIRC